MRISVIIITRDQRPFLEQTLPRLRDQHGLDEPPEIVVVDSGSTDGALEYTRSLPGVRLVTTPPRDFRYARAHNIGAHASSGDVLVRLSGDAVPIGPNFLRDLAAPLIADPAVALTWGRQVLPPGLRCSPFERLGQRLLYEGPSAAGPPRRAPRHRTVFGSAMAVRRPLWESHPYDERLPQAEDYAWAQHWLRRGFAGVYVPEAAVLHGHDEPLLRSLRRATMQSALQVVIYAGLVGR